MAPRKKKEADAQKKAGPLQALKPYDIVKYTPVDGTGNKLPPEIHVILPETYEQDVEKMTFYKTLLFKEKKCCCGTLFLWDSDSGELEMLTDSHELKQVFHGGKTGFKLSKKKAAAEKTVDGKNAL